MSGLIQITPFQLEQIVATAVEIGVGRVIEKKEYMSQTAAFKKYGRRTVERWIKENKITPIKQVGLVKFKVNKLEELSKINELQTKYMNSYE
jgi:hypothetical protein